MKSKRPSVVVVLIIVCGILLVGCSQPDQQLSPATQSAFPVSPSPSQGENLSPVSPPYTLAILPFEDYSTREDFSWLRQAIPDMLVTDLALLPGVRVVSRHRLGEVLKEQWLQHRGTFEESASVRLGRLIGARYLLSGMYYFVEGRLIVEGHLVDVERGAVARTVRVSGSPESVPSIEFELAERLAIVFSGSRMTDEPEKSDINIASHQEKDVVQGSIPLAKVAETLSLETDKIPYRSGPPMTLRTDTLLSMERFRDLRETAVTLADEIWKHAVTVRLGSPNYESLPLLAQMFQVFIPVAAQIQPAWFSRVRTHVHVLQQEMNARDNTILVSMKTQDRGARQLFVESMQSPRRLFVRAIGDSGAVLGVASEWSWRTDQHVQQQSDETIELIVSPQFLFEGKTRFWGVLFANYGTAVHFDSIIVPVPNEARVISIEPITESDQTQEPTMIDATWGPILRTWLLKRWVPPVAESIPVGGYLPGNIRRSVVVLSGIGGTVHETRVIQRDAEEGVSRSIQEVISQLPGECFVDCKTMSSKKAAPPKPFQLRLQFKLVKDIRFAGLNRKP